MRLISPILPWFRTFVLPINNTLVSIPPYDPSQCEQWDCHPQAGMIHDSPHAVRFQRQANEHTKREFEARTGLDAETFYVPPCYANPPKPERSTGGIVFNR